MTGKKKKRGRPAMGKKPQTARAVSLDDDVVSKLNKIGNGNMSAGIRKLVGEYYAK